MYRRSRFRAKLLSAMIVAVCCFAVVLTFAGIWAVSAHHTTYGRTLLACSTLAVVVGGAHWARRQREIQERIAIRCAPPTPTPQQAAAQPREPLRPLSDREIAAEAVRAAQAARAEAERQRQNAEHLEWQRKAHYYETCLRPK